MFWALLIENMNLSRAKAQRRKGTKKNQGDFSISYSDSATPCSVCNAANY
jgi:hypothetical protein